MSDLNTLQQQLHQGRQQTNELQQQLTKERAAVKALDEALRQLNRRAGANDQAWLVARAALEEKRAAASVNASDLAGRLKAAAVADRERLGQLVQLGDPTRLVEQLSDQTPFLLFPVRLETRFKKVNQVTQLWVRIYPDDCLADNFEEMLTEAEVEEAQRFWTSMWGSGGIEAQQRAAWRTLVASFGAGRATWIYRQYQPLNIAARPSKLNPQDQLLTIATDKELSAAEATAAMAFWTAVWLADGDSVQEQAAFDALTAATDGPTAMNILQNYKPANIGDAPPAPYKRNEVQVSVAFVVFPADGVFSTNSSTWTKAPAASLLPDQFVVMGFRGGKQVLTKTGSPVPSSLDLGPDPSLPKEEQLKLTDEGDLVLNDGLKWLTDFERAEAVGMAVKIGQGDLSGGNLNDGFDQLIVLGLRLSDTAVTAKGRLQGLLEHHYYSKRGMELLPQGVPTNNTEETSGYTRLDNADESYGVVFGGKDLFTETNDLWEKKDGQWLAEYTGLDTDFFKTVPHAGGNDQGEARALNTALWPATLGNFMDEMMDNVFTDQDIVQTRNFFNRYVSGRGAVPAIRIGKQPYGILPATAFSRLEFANDPTVSRIYNVVKGLDAAWAKMSEGVATVVKPGPKPHQQILDVVALQASSVEFHQRYAESLTHVFNYAKLGFAEIVAAIIAEFVREKAQALLTAWKIDPKKEVPILDKLFLSKHNLLSGDLIDDTPLSETSAIRAYSADGKNYLEWLATVSFDDIIRENFGGKKAPTALLYLLLRHAVMEQHNQTSRQLYQENNIFANAKVAMREPDLLFIAEKETGTSQLKYLYQTQDTITKKPGLTVAEYIGSDLRRSVVFPNYYLSEVFRALEFLKDVPTARLERLLTEHLDSCSYRLDAWMLGFGHYRLDQQRLRREGGGGIYLGAYGFVENLKPENKVLTPVQLTPELDAVFNNEPGLPPLQRDSTNAGYLHAPSINQATTAAILKNAYIGQAGQTGDNPFEIDLSSERVRLALGVLEGIRNGQSLAALLGYRFERGLHDAHSLGKGEVDVLIYPLRMVFPLVAGKIEPDPPPAPSNEPQSIQNMESRNVLDGLQLLDHIRKSSVKDYPWGLPIGDKPGQVHAATAAQKTAVQDEVNALFDLQDAVGDLLLSESVYQAVTGNYEKAAANTDVSGKGSYPPETEVVQTPRSGITLTHRVALQLNAAAVAAAGDTPRAKAEPALNDWLKGVLPAAGSVAAIVKFVLPDASAGEVTVTQNELGLGAIDLLYLLDLHSDTAMSELDDRIVDIVRRNNAKHPGAVITIAYTQKIPGSISFFELAALLKSLRVLLLPSRYLEATDLALPLQQGLSEGVLDDAGLKARVAAAKDALRLLLPGIQTLINDVASAVEDYAALIKPVLLQLSMYGVPQTGIGFIGDTIAQIYGSVQGKLKPLIERWDGRLAEYTMLLGGYAAQPDNAAKFDLLQRAERLISTTVTSPLPADPDNFRVDLENFRTTQFAVSLGKLKDLRTVNVDTLADFLDLAEPVVKNEIAPYDHEFFDVTRKKNDVDDERGRLADFRGVLTGKLTALFDDVNKRITAVETAFVDVDKEKDNASKVKMLLGAGGDVMGADFRFIPRFMLGDAQGTEVGNCVTDSGKLMTFLNTKYDFPLDDWLHGAGRVRMKLQHWENCSFLTEAFGTTQPVLTPLQLPYQADDRWLGMEFPEDYTIAGEKLLYTAHFTAGFNKAGFQCGLLLDEWVEIIPAGKETTGISFHYDQPNTEPPQTLLLVTPAQLRGSWQWKDITDAIQETFMLARKRAVDPQLIDGSAYAQLLPAVMMSANIYPILVATNLAINNQLYEKIKPN